MPNAQVQGPCVLKMRVDKKIDESVLRWFGHIERMRNDRVRVREGCMEGFSVDRRKKRWRDSMNSHWNKKEVWILAKK